MAMQEKHKNRASKISKGMINLITGLLIIGLVNYIGANAHYQFDLTAEKRHTLNDNTVDLLESLEDVVFIKVYLKGEFSKEYKRLAQATKEKLNQLRSTSNGRIEYEFIDPSESEDSKERLAFYRQLQEKGMLFTSEPSGNSETGERIIWPCAMVTYGETEIPVQLMKGEAYATISENIEKAINNLEYNFSNAIQKFLISKTQNVAVLGGHGELEGYEFIEFKQQLEEYYNVEYVTLNGQKDALKGYDAVIVAKPDTVIPNIDKFILDQFVMNGGRMLWMIDPMVASMDSLNSQVSTTMALVNRLNIEDQLFKYGVNLNANLVMDMQAAIIPIGDKVVAGQQQFTPYPWYYYPIAIPKSEHPIAKNLDGIKLRFVSSIDTINNPAIKKTILLHTSKYSRVVNSPVRVSLNMLKTRPKPEIFNKPFQPVAVLLEGEFESVYRYNMPAGLDKIEGFKPREVSLPNKMIVISDGDIARNDVVYPQNGGDQVTTFPLGFDRFTQQVYSNSTFLLNCMNYLLDDGGLITARAKDQKIRIIDEKQIDDRATFWKTVNIIIPLLLVILFGIGRSSLRVASFTERRRVLYLSVGIGSTVLLAVAVMFMFFTLVPEHSAAGILAAIAAVIYILVDGLYKVIRDLIARRK